MVRLINTKQLNKIEEIMMRYLMLLLLALPLVSFADLKCDPELSTDGQCWTNCTTDNEVTICDIIDLDALFPESEPQNIDSFQAQPQTSILSNK